MKAEWCTTTAEAELLFPRPAAAPAHPRCPWEGDVPLPVLRAIAGWEFAFQGRRLSDSVDRAGAAADAPFLHHREGKLNSVVLE